MEGEAAYDEMCSHTILELLLPALVTFPRTLSRITGVMDYELGTKDGVVKLRRIKIQEQADVGWDMKWQ